MSWLWLIPVGIIILVLVSRFIVVELANLMTRHERKKLIQEEMACIEEEYRILCGS
jgi:hypothetical protein